MTFLMLLFGLIEFLVLRMLDDIEIEDDSSKCV